MHLGFVGLGKMGQAMARVLLRAGHTVAVWNRTRQKAEELAATDGARVAASPAEAARGAVAVLSSLADDDAVRAAVLGLDGSQIEPLIRGLGRGAPHVSLSTIGPALSRHLDEAHRAAGQRYVAAPLLGRPDAAARGDLVVLAAGHDDAVDFCAPIFDLLGRKTHRLGAHPERANAMKIAANLAMASLLESFGEAFGLAESYGIGAMQVLGVLEDTILRSESTEAYGRRIAKGEFEPAGFSLRLGLKDVDLALGAAETAALPLPFASVLRDRFLVAIARGLEEKDWSAMARTLPHKRAA
jgi:3-hydroxyisobutyrate dehydrogenase-like beta-hydroxyacid dehydrogenase